MVVETGSLSFRFRVKGFLHGLSFHLGNGMQIDNFPLLQCLAVINKALA